MIPSLAGESCSIWPKPRSYWSICAISRGCDSNDSLTNPWAASDGGFLGLLGVAGIHAENRVARAREIRAQAKAAQLVASHGHVALRAGLALDVLDLVGHLAGLVAAVLKERGQALRAPPDASQEGQEVVALNVRQVAPRVKSRQPGADAGGIVLGGIAQGRKLGLSPFLGLADAIQDLDDGAEALHKILGNDQAFWQASLEVGYGVILQEVHGQGHAAAVDAQVAQARSEEHTSELQS